MVSTVDRPTFEEPALQSQIMQLRRVDNLHKFASIWRLNISACSW